MYLLVQVLAFNTHLFDSHVSVSDPFDVVDLFTFQILTLRDCLLQHILRFLVLSDQAFLIVLYSLEVIGEACDVTSRFINLLGKFGVSITFIKKVVLHVLIDFVKVIFSLQSIISNSCLLHGNSQMLLELSFLSCKTLKFMMHCI